MKGRPAPERTIVIDGKPLPEVLDEAMVHAVVHGFYGEVRKDDLLGPIFNGHIAPKDWPAHLATMCDFWSATLLRTDRYAGRPLPPHLAIPGLQEQHFRRWLTHFRTAVERTCPADVSELFLDRALRIAHSFRLAIAFNRGEDSMAVTPIWKEAL
ncbi:Group 3 truncated hemoglobin ctb [Ensifer adhaerens]|uniref:Hemoglobin n=1 Tax=Ensifer adhaerens TaxID=106592 RepID=A0ACC5SU13_ENSAD|nr:group III truncated hemoglobin [Ensifer adhaerens]MBP1872298.1 hemoglobin [Ensifer adhaerens]NRP21036.1 Group 3 truncated hemoglobin ctb [Ensifer adhaerens]